MDNLWIIIIILLLIVELLSSNVVTIWYAISAICALIVSKYTQNYLIQATIFILLGTILLIIFRPIFNEKLKKIIRKIKRVK